MCISKHVRSSAHAGQDLDTVDPESGPHKEATDVLSTANIFKACQQLTSDAWHTSLTELKRIASLIPAPLSNQLPRVVIIHKLEPIDRSSMVDNYA